jgi:hypothetical protein
MVERLTEDDLRAMVRESIARVRTAARAVGAEPGREAGAPGVSHISHGLLPLLRGADGDGMCLIEPTVRCNHCSYCLSYGH